jgi:Ca2+-transporting ATPase
VWFDLVGIALAMALLPEEFPVILTIFLSLGAWRIAQKRVLTRHMPAVAGPACNVTRLAIA